MFPHPRSCTHPTAKQSAPLINPPERGLCRLAGRHHRLTSPFYYYYIFNFSRIYRSPHSSAGRGASKRSVSRHALTLALALPARVIAGEAPWELRGSNSGQDLGVGGVVEKCFAVDKRADGHVWGADGGLGVDGYHGGMDIRD